MMYACAEISCYIAGGSSRTLVDHHWMVVYHPTWHNKLHGNMFDEKIKDSIVDMYKKAERLVTPLTPSVCFKFNYEAVYDNVERISALVITKVDEPNVRIQCVTHGPYAGELNRILYDLTRVDYYDTNPQSLALDITMNQRTFLRRLSPKTYSPRS